MTHLKVQELKRMHLDFGTIPFIQFYFFVFMYMYFLSNTLYHECEVLKVKTYSFSQIMYTM